MRLFYRFIFTQASELGQQLSDGKQQEIGLREQLLKLEAENAKSAKLVEKSEALEAELKASAAELDGTIT